MVAGCTAECALNADIANENMLPGRLPERLMRMPEANGMGVVASITGIVGFLVGGALSLIGLGKKIERVESGLARSHERHDLQDRKIASFDEAIKNLMAVFTRDDGEPRFTSAVVCERERVSCHESMVERFSSGAERMGNIEREIKEIRKDQADNLGIIIDEIRKNK